MGIFNWAEKKAQKFKWYDFSILKLTVFAFSLWLAIIWPAVLGLNTWIYFIVFLVGWVYLLWKMLK